jgi:hypothetical protein
MPGEIENHHWQALVVTGHTGLLLEPSLGGRLQQGDRASGCAPNLSFVHLARAVPCMDCRDRSRESQGSGLHRAMPSQRLVHQYKTYFQPVKNSLTIPLTPDRNNATGESTCAPVVRIAQIKRS